MTFGKKEVGLTFQPQESVSSKGKKGSDNSDKMKNSEGFYMKGGKGNVNGEIVSDNLRSNNEVNSSLEQSSSYTPGYYGGYSFASREQNEYLNSTQSTSFTRGRSTTINSNFEEKGAKRKGKEEKHSNYDNRNNNVHRSNQHPIGGSRYDLVDETQSSKSNNCEQDSGYGYAMDEQNGNDVVEMLRSAYNVNHNLNSVKTRKGEMNSLNGAGGGSNVNPCTIPNYKNNQHIALQIANLSDSVQKMNQYVIGGYNNQSYPATAQMLMPNRYIPSVAGQPNQARSVNGGGSYSCNQVVMTKGIMQCAQHASASAQQVPQLPRPVPAQVAQRVCAPAQQPLYLTSNGTVCRRLEAYDTTTRWRSSVLVKVGMAIQKPPVQKDQGLASQASDLWTTPDTERTSSSSSKGYVGPLGPGAAIPGGFVINQGLIPAGNFNSVQNMFESQHGLQNEQWSQGQDSGSDRFMPNMTPKNQNPMSSSGSSSVVNLTTGDQSVFNNEFLYTPMSVTQTPVSPLSHIAAQTPQTLKETAPSTPLSSGGLRGFHNLGHQKGNLSKQSWATNDECFVPTMLNVTAAASYYQNETELTVSSNETSLTPRSVGADWARKNENTRLAQSSPDNESCQPERKSFVRRSFSLGTISQTLETQRRSLIEDEGLVELRKCRSELCFETKESMGSNCSEVDPVDVCSSSEYLTDALVSAQTDATTTTRADSKEATTWGATTTKPKDPASATKLWKVPESEDEADDLDELWDEDLALMINEYGDAEEKVLDNVVCSDSCVVTVKSKVMPPATKTKMVVKSDYVGTIPKDSMTVSVNSVSGKVMTDMSETEGSDSVIPKVLSECSENTGGIGFKNKELWIFMMSHYMERCTYRKPYVNRFDSIQRVTIAFLGATMGSSKEESEDETNASKDGFRGYNGSVFRKNDIVRVFMGDGVLTITPELGCYMYVHGIEPTERNFTRCLWEVIQQEGGSNGDERPDDYDNDDAFKNLGTKEIYVDWFRSRSWNLDMELYMDEYLAGYDPEETIATLMDASGVVLNSCWRLPFLSGGYQFKGKKREEGTGEILCEADFDPPPDSSITLDKESGLMRVDDIVIDMSYFNATTPLKLSKKKNPSSKVTHAGGEVLSTPTGSSIGNLIASRSKEEKVAKKDEMVTDFTSTGDDEGDYPILENDMLKRLDDAIVLSKVDEVDEMLNAMKQINHIARDRAVALGMKAKGDSPNRGGVAESGNGSIPNSVDKTSPTIMEKIFKQPKNLIVLIGGPKGFINPPRGAKSSKVVEYSDTKYVTRAARRERDWVREKGMEYEEDVVLDLFRILPFGKNIPIYRISFAGVVQFASAVAGMIQVLNDGGSLHATLSDLHFVGDEVLYESFVRLISQSVESRMKRLTTFNQHFEERNTNNWNCMSKRNTQERSACDNNKNMNGHQHNKSKGFLN